MNYEEGREAILQNIEVAMLTYKLAMAGGTDNGEVEINGMPENEADRDRVARMAAVISACVAQTGSETVNIEADALILLQDDMRYVVAAEKAFREAGDATSEWIPVRFHEITDPERAENGYPEEWEMMFDCKMPDDGQEVLITTRSGYVLQDTAYCDIDGTFLDRFDDWLDVLAWMPLPEPYREEKDT